jgi:hypothetical protein
MHRAILLVVALAAAALAAAGGLACGDIVIPSNATDDGGASGDDNGDDVSIDARPPPNCDAGTHPVALACTGLYTDWTQLTLAPDVHVYQPGATMWADGADATRWIWIPPGSKIDSSSPNDWVFPVGTKLWQELRLLGKRVETRFLWKMAPSLWFRTTYEWNETESAAPEVTTGQPNARGLPYEIPAVSACERCHGGEADFVLGFEMVGLAMPQSSGLNLQAIAQQGLLTSPPVATPTIPGDPTSAGALAFLHANCGTSCHNRGADANGGATGLFLKLIVDARGALPATPQATDTWATSYKVPSNFTPGGYDAGGFWRIKPADVAHSTIPWRTSRRDGLAQMPPLETHVVDQNDVKLLGDWIGAMPP